MYKNNNTNNNATTFVEYLLPLEVNNILLYVLLAYVYNVAIRSTYDNI